MPRFSTGAAMREAAKGRGKAGPMDGRVKLVRLGPLPPEALARIRAVMDWEDAGGKADYVLGPVSPPARDRSEPVAGEGPQDHPGTVEMSTDGRTLVLSPGPLPPESVARIRAAREWEDAATRGVDFVLGPVRG